MLAPGVSKAELVTVEPIGAQGADLLELAPRVGVEPTSLVLIQSQAGPAGRPTGDSAEKVTGPRRGSISARQTNRG